jgi:hypothetical protein
MDYAESITINATTGVPISQASGASPADLKTIVRYRVSRVNYPGLAGAGSGSSS